jgi:hypothetical protein
MRFSAPLRSLTLVLLVMFPHIASAQEEDFVKFVGHAESMVGVTKMRVVVEEIPALRNVLPASVVKEAAEAKLRTAGIDVEASSAGRLPWLYINVTALETGRGYVYSVQVSYSCYLEIPTLDLDVVKFVRGETWSQGTIGTAAPGDAQSIRKTVEDQVSAFLNVYLGANPGTSNHVRLR